MELSFSMREFIIAILSFVLGFVLGSAVKWAFEVLGSFIFGKK